MNSLIDQIQKLLNEEIDTSTARDIEQHSARIDKGMEGLKVKKNAPKPKRANKSEDLTDLSKKDLKDEEGKESSEDQEENSENVPTPDESPSTINLSDALSFENLIDILNQFRAAHSFTDKKIYTGLKNYFNKLEDAEKKVLHVFIKGLIQVTMLNVDGKTAYSPSDLMFSIAKTGKASSEKKKSQQTAQKASAESKSSSKSTMPITKIGS
tara:strand:+ start:23977 stop:24609 length:633 start_codon:yes stop_codon:yes gene_type:complete